MKLPQLRALLATVEGRSLHAAARLLHRTQPGISAALAGLERDLGVRLVDRAASGVRPTAEGRLLAARIAEGFARLAAGGARAGLSESSVQRLCRQATDGQLQALSALVDARGFSHAAHRRRVSQPSIHRAVSTLGRLLGTRLWVRRGRLIEVTPEAIEIAAGANLCRSELRLGEDELRETIGQLDGWLLLGALPTARAAWLPGSLVRLTQEFPLANVSIMDGPYEEQLRALRQGRIDIILGQLRHPAPGPDIVQEAVLQDSLSIVVRQDHPLARAASDSTAPLGAAQLASLRWLLPPPETPARQCFESYLRKMGVGEPAPVIECNSFLTIRAVLLQTECAAVVPTGQARSEIGRSRLVTLGTPVERSAHAVGWAMRRGFRGTQLMGGFLDIARRCARL